MRFINRKEAGQVLARHLEHLRDDALVVVGLPRGGVPVAREVAASLGAPLDVIVIRKLGVPFQPELAMGAIGEDGVRILNRETIRLAGITDRELTAVEERERLELQRRLRRFRSDRPGVSLEGQTVVVVDDGIATGSTARAACQVARARGAARIVLAVPVAPPGWTKRIAGAADEYVCVATPEPFYAIGQFYADFTQVTDDEVTACLVDNDTAGPTAAAGDDPPGRDEEVSVPAGDVTLPGRLTVPDPVIGMVVFAHGSGSSRHSPRNRHVAAILHAAGIGTLLFDLLTSEEEHDRSNVFDIELLGGRLIAATSWVHHQSGLASLPLGYFGASTGAAAALWAAAQSGTDVTAVVSRGGRPDLAGSRLSAVRAATLLVVGGEDRQVLELNRRAAASLRCEHRLAVVPGATHLFAEPGTLQAAAESARDWFGQHFVSTSP